MISENINIRRYIIFTVLTLLLIWGGVALHRYLSSGVITADVSGKGNFVIIESASDNKTYHKQAAGSLSVRVPAGAYRITAQGSLWTSYINVVLDARGNITHSFKPTVVGLVEPVAGGVSPTDIAATDSYLYFVNNFAGVAKIDAQNTMTQNNTVVTSVKWADPDYGIGRDDDGNLYIVSGGVPRPLKLNIPLRSNTRYSILPSRQFYISDGPTIYFGNESGVKKIYRAPKTPAQLIGSSSRVAVIMPPNNGEGKPSLSLISASGSLLRTGEAPGGAGVWSPDGKLLAIGGYPGEGIVMNTRLEKVATLPSNQSIAWLDNDSLLFSQSGNIWQFDVVVNSSSMIATSSPNSSITNLSVDKNKQYVYFSLQNDSSGNAEASPELARFGLRGQKVPSLVSQLDAFFPEKVVNCNINYVNFTRPVFVVSGYKASEVCPVVLGSELTSLELDSYAWGTHFVDSDGL